MVDKWYGKKMDLPIKNKVVNGDKKYKYLFDNFNSKIKIVTFIDASCGSCLLSFDFWKNFFKEMNIENLNCGFIPYIKVSDSTYFKNNIAKELDMEFTWIFDKDGQFIKINKLFDSRFQTALLNEKNEVILIGNPVLNPALRKLYVNIIRDIDDQ